MVVLGACSGGLDSRNHTLGMYGNTLTRNTDRLAQFNYKSFYSSKKKMADIENSANYKNIFNKKIKKKFLTKENKTSRQGKRQ